MSRTVDRCLLTVGRRQELFGLVGFFRQDMQDCLDYYSPQRLKVRRVFFMGHRFAQMDTDYFFF